MGEDDALVKTVVQFVVRGQNHQIQSTVILPEMGKNMKNVDNDFHLSFPGKILFSAWERFLVCSW